MMMEPLISMNFLYWSLSEVKQAAWNKDLHLSLICLYLWTAVFFQILLFDVGGMNQKMDRSIEKNWQL